MAGLLAGLPLDLLLSPWALALLGLAVGSFLNVVVHRLPLMLERQWWGDVAAQLADGDSFQRVFVAAAPGHLAQAGGALEQLLSALKPLTLSRPGSRCPSCGHSIRWFENLPVLSWLALKGRCSACGTRIARRYPLVEAATALLFGLVAWRVGPQPQALLWCGVVALQLGGGGAHRPALNGPAARCRRRWARLPARGSVRWPRRPGRRCGSVRCRKAARGCARRRPPAAGR